MNAAQPFIFIVVHIGRTKRETERLTFIFCSAEANVTGNVHAELLVNNATAKAEDICLNTSTGFNPLAFKNKGITIKN